MTLVRPTDTANVVPAVVAVIDQLENNLRVKELAIGSATVTWPGGQTFSDVLQVRHGLSAQALVFLMTSGSGLGFGLGPLSAPPTFIGGVGGTAQHWQVQAFTVDGTSPAGGTTLIFSWLAAR